jgi:hypothetical protein
LWQTNDFQFRHGLQYAAAADLDAFALVFIDQVHRHFHSNCMCAVNALEVGVHNARFGGVALQRLDHNQLRLPIDHQSDDVREKRFVRSRFQDVFVWNRNGFRCRCTAINDGWYKISQTTQAAARTLPQVVSGTGIQFKSIGHNVSPVLKRLPDLRPV